MGSQIGPGEVQIGVLGGLGVEFSSPDGVWDPKPAGLGVGGRVARGWIDARGGVRRGAGGFSGANRGGSGPARTPEGGEEEGRDCARRMGD